MKNYLERLEGIKKELKDWNCEAGDVCPLYYCLMEKNTNECNYLYKEKLLPFLKEQFNKRVKKDNFNKKLFSKILFNNLYLIRKYKDDLIPYGVKKGSNEWKYWASHQYIRRELESYNIDTIILLSYELVKHFKKLK